MRNQTSAESLNAKVTLLIEKYTRVRDENIMLSEALAESKKEIASLKEEMVVLKENDELKDMELEDISDKITKFLS